MGSGSAMRSIERVMRDHSEELTRENEAAIPDEIKHLTAGVTLEGDIYGITVWWKIKTFQNDEVVRLEGPTIDIDTLAERYPCCEVGY